MCLSLFNSFFLLVNNKKGFQKKGGLFNEFANRNNGMFEMNKRNHQDKRTKDNKPTEPSSLGKLYQSYDCSNFRNRKHYVNGNNSSNSNLSGLQQSNVTKAKKVINDNNLFKIKDVYMKSISPNHSKEQLHY